MIGHILYIFSLAFQIAGAILLLFKYLGKTKKRIISEYYPSGNIAEYNDKDELILKKKEVRACAQQIYANRFSFAFIVIGYALSVFGDMPSLSRVCVFSYIFFTAATIIVLEKIISVILSYLIYRKDLIFDYKKVVKNIFLDNPLNLEECRELMDRLK